jgi:hypothetical protein
VSVGGSVGGGKYFFEPYRLKPVGNPAKIKSSGDLNLLLLIYLLHQPSNSDTDRKVPIAN